MSEMSVVLCVCVDNPDKKSLKTTFVRIGKAYIEMSRLGYRSLDQGIADLATQVEALAFKALNC